MKKRFAFKLILMFSLVSLLLAGCTSKQEKVNKEKQEKVAEYSGDLNLITTAKWTKENLDNITILDVRDEKEYKKGHIPNAINVKWQDFAQIDGKETGDKDWGNLLQPNEMSKVLQSLGIDNSKTIVVYGNPPEGWGEDGRVAWTLLSSNLEKVKILNGGWNSWKSADFKVSKDSPNITKSNFTVENLDSSLVITTDKLFNNLKDFKIIDTREKKEFEGATKFGEVRGGHIPDAINITWNTLLNSDGTIKSQKEIDNILKENNISKNDKIVTYCTGGIRSGHMTLVLKMAGYDAVNYDSSIYEWSANKDLPLVK